MDLLIKYSMDFLFAILFQYEMISLIHSIKYKKDLLENGWEGTFLVRVLFLLFVILAPLGKEMFFSLDFIKINPILFWLILLCLFIFDMTLIYLRNPVISNPKYKRVVLNYFDYKSNLLNCLIGNNSYKVLGVISIIFLLLKLFE